MSIPSSLSQAALDALTTHRDSYTDVLLFRASDVLAVDTAKAEVSLTLRLGFTLTVEAAETLKAELAALLSPYFSEQTLRITFKTEIAAHRAHSGQGGLSAVKNIIAIASAKGGVGKSTTTVNLALALSAQGAKVGILDADIYGPSLPILLGIHDHPESPDGKKLLPLSQYGIQSMSIGYLVDQKAAIAWRGPMVSRALQQLLNDTAWQDLDYLLIDMPPGTGDIQLTLAQKLPISAAIVVTTPQDIALADAARGIALFEKVNIPVLGLVENMSTHVCSACGHEEAIFGAGGAARLAANCQQALLGQIPLDRSICQDADDGKPTVISAIHSPLTQRYHQIATRAGARLAQQKASHGHKFPKIVIE